MMASDLSSGCTDTIDILDDEKEEGEISLEDVSSSEEGGMGHLTSSYVVGRTRACPDCKSWGECATWCNATYHPKNRRDPVKGKENRHHVRETGCATTKHVASTLQEKNDDDDLVPISSDSDMEIVGLTDTSNRAKAKVKKKKRKKKKYEPLTLDELLSPSSIDLSIAEVGALKIYKEVSPAHRPSGRSKMISRSPVRRYRSPVVARASFRLSRSPVSHSRSPIQKRSPRKARSPKRSPRRHSPVRAAKRPPPKLSSPLFARSHVPERHDDVTRLLKKVKHLDSSITTHSSEPSVNRSKESSSLKEKLSNILKGAGIDDHAVHLKEKLKSETINDADDEEDLAFLRQKALETKQKKSNRSSDHLTDVESENRSADDRVNDDQDEEALQLRMIALRSAVMKKHQNRVQRGIKAKRSTRSESPFSSSFLDDIPVPGDELLKYASPPCTPPCDSNHIEDMDLDTDVEMEKEKLPYSPTDKIESISFDTALLGIEPSDVSFINVNETIGSPVFDDAQDELAMNRVTPYYDEIYLPYQVPLATQYCSYSPSRYGSETYHSDLNNAVGKGPENLHGDDVVCDLIDGICCQEGTYSSTSVVSDTSHALPASESLLAPSVSPHDTLASSPQMQQIVEQPTNDGIVFVNVNSAFRNGKSAYETQTTPEYSVTDAPTTTVYAESMSPNESMITIDDLPENDADPLSSPNVALGDDRNLPATEYIPKEAGSCRAAAEEPLYMQGIPDITKETNKIPTLINRTLVPAPILRSNRQLRRQTRQNALLKKRETPLSEPAFKSAEMQPVTITATDASSSVFKPIKLQVAKKSAPVLSASATFDDSMNESLDVLENQKGSPGKNHEASEPQHPETSVGTPSASSEAAPTRSKKRKRAKKNCPKSLDTAQLLEKEKSPCLDAGVNKDTDIVDASVLDRQIVTESDQSKSNDNADAQESSMGNGESLRLQSVTDTQEPVNSDDVLTKRRDMDKNNYTALSVRIEQSQEEHIESHCLSTNPAPDNSDSSVPDKAVNTMKSDSNRRQSIDEDEDELRAILLASLKRTKSTDISPSVIPVISVTSSAATNVQTPALKTLAGTMPSEANATCTASNNASSLPSRPSTSLETVKKKINDVSISVQNGSRKRSSSLDTAKSLPKKMARKTLTSTKVVINAKKKYQNMIVQRRLNLRKLDNSASITKSNENVWPNAGASKISLHAPDTQRFVISLGSDSDSESEGERNEPVPVAEKHQVPQEIPADFEKNLNKFLRDVRTEQEQSAAAAKSSSSSTQATKQDVPSTDKGPSNMHTPLAVRHLPVSQQEEYRRLKQEILEREKLKLQRKVASNNSNSNGNSSSNKLLNANVASSPVKSLPLCEKKTLVKQNQDKLKTPEKNSQELSIEVRRKSDDLARGTSESNVCRISADKKLSANIAKHTNFTHLQTKSNKKAIPNNLSIRISNVTAPSSTGAGTRTVEDREKQSAKDKQQHRSALRALSKEEINRKCVQVLLKPDTIERVVTISDKSALQHDTIISVDQNKNPAEPDVNTEIINEKNLNNVDDNNTSTFSNASTVKLLNLSVNSSDSRHEDTMETTMMFSQYEAERQREIGRDTSTSVLTENNNNSNNASRKSDTIADDNNGNASDGWDTLKKDVKAELESLTSLSKLEQERYLRETENKLIARRYMVLDHLAEMSGNLRQWDMEKDVQIILASEVRKLREQLKIAEEKLQQQRDRVSSMGPKVSTARQKINAGRRECFKLSRICSTLGNRLMGKNYKLPEAVAQLLSDKLKEIANHTRQITKKKRLQSNDISENSYSSLLQETSELSRYTCTEENLSLQEQPTNNATVIDEAGSKSDISRSTQSNEDKSLSISETLLNFSQTVPCQSTPEKREEASVNPSEHCNEEQMIFLNQDSASSSEPKLYQSSPTEQNNKHTEGSRTVESDPAASSELKSSAMDSSNQEYNEQNNKRASPQLPSPSPSASPSSPSPSPSPSLSPPPSPPPSPSPSPSPLRSRSPSPTTMTTDTTTTNTTMTTTTTRTTKTIAPYVSILMHLKKPRNINPHGILCPYELMGICRDEDCQYIHQSRNQT